MQWQKGDAMASPIELPSSKEYREFAEECLRWAARAVDADQRSSLVEIARVWMQMAADIEYLSKEKNEPPKLAAS